METENISIVKLSKICNDRTCQPNFSWKRIFVEYSFFFFFFLLLMLENSEREKLF